jgi:hypothetical protein
MFFSQTQTLLIHGWPIWASTERKKTNFGQNQTEDFI